MPCPRPEGTFANVEWQYGLGLKARPVRSKLRNWSGQLQLVRRHRCHCPGQYWLSGAALPVIAWSGS